MLALLVFSLLLATSGRWEWLEERSYDGRVSLLKQFGVGVRPPSGRVVVVGMEEGSMQQKPLIFWYPEMGTFLLKMRDAGASVVALDILAVHSLGEKMIEAASAVSSDQDPKMEAMLRGLGNRADRAFLAPLILTSRDLHLVHAVSDDFRPFYYKRLNYTRNYSLGWLTLTLDPDGVLRKQRLRFDNGVEGLGSAVVSALGEEVPPEASVRVNYLIDRVPYIPFTDLLKEEADLTFFEGKAVILGYISTFEDVHSIPGGQMPGSFIHAAISETLLAGSQVKSLTLLQSALLLTLWIILSLFLVLRFQPGKALLFLAILLLFYIAAATLVLTQDTLIPLFPHAAAPLLLAILLYPYRYFTKERERRKIYQMFSYYIDAEIIEDLLSRGKENLLRGDNREICILFMDIRNFTQLSHGARPEEIVNLLNSVFGPITEIVKRHGGFVNKFIGDGMLAFFGTGENPALNGVKAARDIVACVNDLKGRIPVPGNTPDWQLAVGLGLHFGTVTVGNIGSERKMDFTIIGDPVNLASRIEGLTKSVGHELLISEACAEMVKDEVGLTPVGEHNVKGISKPIQLYTLGSENAGTSGENG